MASIALHHVDKVFANGQAAVRDLSLAIVHGELLVIVGPSGSGKSTVLRLIAGLERPTAGGIEIDGEDVTAVPPARRDVAMVFQSYALYPHKTVRDNLGFALSVHRVPATEIGRRVASVAVSLGIESLLDRKPAQLSGGQRQRVALGRAIVREPKAFLLDEPLSNLDPQRRLETRTELALLHRRLGATMVHVTHDQEEAMTLGTRIAVMREGRLEQVASPMDIFTRPANVFVATFFGSPAMNVWRCRRAQGAGRAARLLCGSVTIELPGDDGLGSREAVLVGIRPHDVTLAPLAQADAAGQVEVAEPLGATTVLHVRIDGIPGGFVRVAVPAGDAPAPGEYAGITLRRDRLHLFDSDTGLSIAPAAVSGKD